MVNVVDPVAMEREEADVAVYPDPVAPAGPVAPVAPAGPVVPAAPVAPPCARIAQCVPPAAASVLGVIPKLGPNAM